MEILVGGQLVQRTSAPQRRDSPLSRDDWSADQPIREDATTQKRRRL